MSEVVRDPTAAAPSAGALPATVTETFWFVWHCAVDGQRKSMIDWRSNFAVACRTPPELVTVHPVARKAVL